MEACERFSYYGMRAILTIYLIYLLKVNLLHLTKSADILGINIEFPVLKPHYPDDEEKASSVATMIFHFFAFGSYASGLLGAALADSKAGPHHHPHVRHHDPRRFYHQQNADHCISLL